MEGLASFPPVAVGLQAPGHCRYFAVACLPFDCRRSFATVFQKVLELRFAIPQIPASTRGRPHYP